MPEIGIFYGVYVVILLGLVSVLLFGAGALVWVIFDTKSKNLPTKTRIIWSLSIAACPFILFLYCKLRKLPDGLVFKPSDSDKTAPSALRFANKLMPMLSFASFAYLVYVVWSTGLLKELIN